MANPVGRFEEIDVLRGLALLLMIAYHFLYDLNEFFGFHVAYNEGLFYLTGKTAAVLFIMVAGISCSFSRNNNIRAIKLILWGLVIFLVTGIAVPGSNIVFGILHFLGVCLLLYPVFKNMPAVLVAAAGTAVILAGEFTPQVTLNHNWLVPLGFWGPNFYSVDYFPLIPWFGVFLLGIAIRKTVYRQNRSLFKSTNKNLRPMAVVGRNTLIVYLMHQPVILGLLHLAL